jgi:hypothetical protein
MFLLKFLLAEKLEIAPGMELGYEASERDYKLNLTKRLSGEALDGNLKRMAAALQNLALGMVQYTSRNSGKT